MAQVPRQLCVSPFDELALTSIVSARTAGKRCAAFKPAAGAT
eukprot:CAMPEP_0184097148 /NCGR_PEP_ID=MMETSP0974-20121125/10657_1 /TAXON_ID=483370 /ORGANISM="non described non described, Strain CCMP2097" /LENGTH=41 /DNA_ID= /DNA_START= /DNA_END= /DNA_ORIENTATION=